jgi:hypothetical protein
MLAVEDGGLGVRPILPETEALDEEGDRICLGVDMAKLSKAGWQKPWLWISSFMMSDQGITVENIRAPEVNFMSACVSSDRV